MREPPVQPTPPPATSASPLVTAVRFLWPGRASRDFGWFSSLGWPDVQGRPFVRVAEQEEWTRKQQIAAQKHLRGFLLEESSNSSTVFLTTLRTTQVHRQRESPVVEPADLLQEARTYLAFLRHPVNWELQPKGGDAGQRVSQAVETFVLAWACEQNGYRAVARQLYRQARRMRPGKRSARLLGRAPKRLSLRAQLERELSTAWMWHTIQSFQFPNLSTWHLLRQVQALLRNFPQSPHVPLFQKHAAILKQMLREEAEHARNNKPFEQMNQEEQLRELIFQLRTQNGFPREQGGACDIFLDPRGEASPAHQLLKLGLEAVPELIRSFEDRSFTRSVGHHRDPSHSPRVLTVGECAMTIVQTIFGRSFTDPGNVGHSAQQIADGWWKEAQGRGIAQMLAEGVEHGKETSARQAEVLLRNDPLALATALPRGFAQALEPWVKRDLVAIAARVPGEAIVPFLQERLHSHHLQWAVMAAWGLHQRGNPAAVPRMIQRWKDKLGDGRDGEEGVDILVGFLVASADEGAIEALAADLRQRSAALRLKVVETLADGAFPFSLDPNFPGLWSEQMRKKLSPRALETLEQLLVACLDDTAGGQWTIIGPNGQNVQNPRVCDYAGKLLAEQWKDKYQFNFWGSLAERDRQRLAILVSANNKKGE